MISIECLSWIKIKEGRRERSVLFIFPSIRMRSISGGLSEYFRFSTVFEGYFWGHFSTFLGISGLILWEIQDKIDFL